MSRKNLLLAGASAVVALITAFYVATVIDGHGGSEIVVQSIASDATIVVWIEGAVSNPGVYRLSADARLDDAINAAGGLSASADLSHLNRAQRLFDMQHIVIPAITGTPITSQSVVVAGVNADPANQTSNIININTANAAELESLPGIGPALASRIIAYREANGPFARIEELARVDGVSPAMVVNLKGKISVGP